MKATKNTKVSLISSVMALLLCFAMLLGTTYAWFTDQVTSAGNTIESGSLKIDLLHKTGDNEWTSVKEKPGHKIFEYKHWEPGFTAVETLKVVNLGTLALRYQLSLVVQINSAELGENGENLADVIDVYVGEGTADNWATIKDTWTHKGTLTEVINNPADFFSGMLEPMSEENTDDEATLTVALHMQESAGNEYQNLSVGTINVNLIATQATYESDSFGSDYDSNAVADIFPGFQGGTASLVVTLDDQGLNSAEGTMAGGDVSAVIPAGVKLTDGNDTLKLTVGLKDDSETNLQLEANEKMRPMDVHMEGVAQDNDTAMVITLKHYLTTGLNIGALALYHVENGVPVRMTHAANPTNHNEFTYDPATGDLTVALASFSEVAVVADTNNPWDGKTLDYQWYNVSATELTIYNADQLAGFAAIVDGKAEGIAQDSFYGKTVKLGNNIYLSNQLFEPIGWGYENKDWNVNDRDGKPFKGTFDGGQYDENGKLVGRYTIFDLYQNGWDLINEGTGEAYTYTNCGFGLFAAASNATFKNLTISGAYVRVECVEAGVLVGLSQNNCTYDNIKILNSKIANYQRPAGGLIGEVSGEGTTTITNVTIGSDVVVGSLWGDFDAPCGGVIGAYWNDVDADPQIIMQYVEVGARLDVYNDITSAYQWHAYRRAGMLIGNTELTDPDNAHKAAAPFLTCLTDDAGNETVKVYYGDWINYTYCNFSNYNPRYPWVRTQAGENCDAFSNPRWGVPNDTNGNRVTDMNHVHAEGDECNVLRQFSQLYGGGQGVYGQDQHEGVVEVKNYYSVTYVNDGQVLDIIYVTDNKNAVDVANDQAKKLVLEWAVKNIEGGTIAFGGWMNAASIKLTEIPKDNTKNIVLYPYFNSPYTASFVDQNGNILAWCLFNDSDVSRLQDAFDEAKKNVPNPGEDFKLIHWKITGTDTKGKEVNTTILPDNTNWESFKGYKDVTIAPHYRYNGVDLIEVYDELTGEIDHYQVAGYTDGVGSTIVEIPGYVNGKPVTTINADAFSSYDDLHSVRIPGTITQINSQSFSADTPDIWNKPGTWGEQRDTITIYYDGDPAVWNEAMKKYNNKDYSGMLKTSWDNMMGESSCVFFLDENGKVDVSKGYWELAKVSSKFVWQYHNHTYGSNSGCGNEHNNTTNYTADCKCDIGTHVRPDAEYWTFNN